MSSRRQVPVLLALVALLGAAFVAQPSPAIAASAQVSVQDFSFTPATVTVGQGQQVTWTFHAMHTTTSRQGFWNSGHRTSGTYAVTFPDAGTFAYYCTMHTSMTGRVKVPLKATGSAASGWTVRWSARTSTPSNRRYDVQAKRVGTTTWTSFRSSTASRSGAFNPSRSATYQLRARTKNVGTGSSSWSPALSVRIS